MVNLLAALQSDDRNLRWDKIVWTASDLVGRDDTTIDESVVPYLTKELTTDYSEYLAEEQARADREWKWKKSLHAAWQVHRAREALSVARAAGTENQSHLEQRLSFEEAQAVSCGIDITQITCDGHDVYYAKDGLFWCPDKWLAQWDHESSRYADIYHPNRLFAAVLVILARLGPKAVSAVPVLLDFAWDSNHDVVQTPWEYPWQCEGGYTFVRVSELLNRVLYRMGPQIIPDLIQALGHGEPAASRATAILEEWGREAVPELLKAVDDHDVVVCKRVKILLAGLRAKARVEKPSRLRDEFSRIHARLLVLVEQDDQKTKERLRTLRSFLEHGSFRQVAAVESKLNGYETDHSGPASRLRRLGESLGVPMTRIAEGQGTKRSELTEEGRALAEWIALHPWALD